ncbi:MAG: hypothetical protein IKJ97_02385 [Bacteroidaceae bacterium]|nr:hypothetical protein [Bacteroidaceae bacterium]
MRKFTLLIASLFITIGAMAQITANTSAYTVKSVNRGFLYYDANNAGSVTSSSHTSITDATPTGLTNEQFAFLRTSNTAADQYYMYSIGASQFVTYTGNNGVKLELTDEPACTWVFVASGTYYGIKVPNTDQTYINITNWQAVNGCKVTATGLDEGNKMTLTEAATELDLSEAIAKIEAFEARVEETLTYTLTDIAGNEFTGTYEGYVGESLPPAFTGATGYSLTNGVWDGTNYTATINFAYPVSNKNDGITNEVLLAQFENKYWHAVGTNIKVQTTTVAAVDANCLWAIYPSLSEGVFTFEIMNVATGKYIHTDATAAAHNSEGTIVLSEIPTEFVINSDKDFKIADKSLYISINSTNDTDVYLGLWGNAHNGTNVTSSTLPQYDVEITEAGYATFYAPVAVTVPDGVTAHTVTINGESAILSEPLATIPAYTGVVLYSQTAQTYTFNVTTTDVTVENNDLEGTVAATYVTDDAYVLGVVGGVVGFYTAETSGQETGTFLNNHHKAYLPKTTGMNAASYSFRFGEGTTGIDQITDNREQSTAIFDLTGRRVEAISAPGIYIINGKKVLVK